MAPCIGVTVSDSSVAPSPSAHSPIASAPAFGNTWSVIVVRPSAVNTSTEARSTYAVIAMRPSSSGTGASSIDANAGWNAVLPESRRSTNRRPVAASYPMRVAASSSPSTLSPTASASPGASTASMRTTSPETGSVSEPSAIGRAASVYARSVCSSCGELGHDLLREPRPTLGRHERHVAGQRRWRCATCPSGCRSRSPSCSSSRASPAGRRARSQNDTVA